MLKMADAPDMNFGGGALQFFSRAIEMGELLAAADNGRETIHVPA